ncbi:DUF805 domain-containing protein [Bombiscardovia coagulans]|uniref:DUF805 domain-containing protein n=1 Tax=Bombiscardovia coagulans TaxID=686666 RepID=A0A261EPE8_9BIFI|nr:DUF805 domain-containing protein [Bombiscardovia coagulans]OZG48738.1 hypothetical protein BOCO_1434 [Bombiscardovia coagulans]
MSIALLENRLPRVGTMKSSDAMYDATLQECLQRPFYLFARGKGRACRKEIWVFDIFVACASYALWSVCDTGAWFIIPIVASAICLIPQYALTVRRLHDLMLSGWWAMLPWGLSLGSYTVFFCWAVVTPDNGPYSYTVPMLALLGMTLGLLVKLVMMCFPSRHYKPTVDNGAVSLDLGYDNQPMLIKSTNHDHLRNEFEEVRGANE